MKTTNKENARLNKLVLATFLFIALLVGSITAATAQEFEEPIDTGGGNRSVCK